MTIEQPVEKKPDNAGSQAGVETTPKAPEVDVELLEATLQAAIDTRDKALQNAENWKKVGMAKKKSDDGQPVEMTDEDVNSRAEIRAHEIVTQNAIVAAKEAEQKALKALKEAREAKIAARNSKGIVTTVTTSSGDGSDVQKSETHGWSSEQLAAMKARGINIEDKKFLLTAWNNYKRSKG